MSRFSNLSIRHKLRLIIVGSTLFALFVVFAGSILYDSRSLRDNLRDELSALAQIAGNRSRVSLLFNDTESAQETLQALNAKKSIVAAALYSPSGDLFAHFNDIPAIPLPPSPREDICFIEKDGMHLFSEIVFDNQKIGTIYLRSDLNEINRRQKRFIAVSIALTLVSLFLAYFFSALLQRRIIENIMGLANTAQMVTRQKDYTLRAKKHTGDELGVLIDDFNNMLVEIQRRDSVVRESELKYKTLVENIPQRIFYKDNNSVYIACNENYAGDLDTTPDKITGKTDYDFYPKELAERYRSDDERIIKSGKVETIEEDYITCDEQHLVVQTVKTPIWDEQGAITGLLGIFMDITERKQVEEAIKKSLTEKEVLLREIHHRVKNNMQVIISMLRLQSEKTEGKRESGILKESQGRIKAMALIHEKLYQSRDLAVIDFPAYVKSLADGMIRSYKIDTNRITTKIEIENILLGLDRAIPCGLIINELVSNSLKYAFPESRKGEIGIALRSVNADEVELMVSDNGVGIPESLDFRNTDSLGLDLVTILAEDQLEGKIELSRDSGTGFHIRFPKQTNVERA